MALQRLPGTRLPGYGVMNGSVRSENGIAQCRHHGGAGTGQRADEEHDPALGLAVLRPLLAGKYRTIKADNDYERSMKLIRFAMGRGFTMELIRKCIDEGIAAADGNIDFADDDDETD